jgi:hypothetical protein
MPDCKSLGNSQRHLEELIEHRCRQLGKSGASKGSALHLAQWMRAQLGGVAITPDEEPEPEVWSPETLRRRSEQLQLQLMGVRADSRCEELELSDTERSRSQTSSDSQVRAYLQGWGHTTRAHTSPHEPTLAQAMRPLRISYLFNIQYLLHEYNWTSQYVIMMGKHHVRFDLTA